MKDILNITSNQTYTESSGDVEYVAETRCWPVFGPQVIYFSGYFTFNPSVRRCLSEHENVHAKQCRAFGFWNYVNTSHHVKEMEAYAAELKCLQDKLNGNGECCEAQ